MREYYAIDGYWKDNKDEFEDYIVTNFDDVEENGMYGEDDIFIFGYNESDLVEAIELKEEVIDDFVITSYTKIRQ